MIDCTDPFNDVLRRTVPVTNCHRRVWKYLLRDETAHDTPALRYTQRREVDEFDATAEQKTEVNKVSCPSDEAFEGAQRVIEMHHPGIVDDHVHRLCYLVTTE